MILMMIGWDGCASLSFEIPWRNEKHMKPVLCCIYWLMALLACIGHSISIVVAVVSIVLCFVCGSLSLPLSISITQLFHSQLISLKKKNDQMNDIEIKPEKHHPTNPGYVAIFQKQLVGYILLVLKYIYVAAWLHTTYTVGDKFPDKPTKKCIKFLEKFRKFSKFYQGLQKQIRNTYLQYIYQQSLSGQFSEIFPFILRKNSSKFMAGNLLSVVCISKWYIKFKWEFWCWVSFSVGVQRLVRFANDVYIIKRFCIARVRHVTHINLW